MRPLFDRGVLTLVDLPPGVTTDMLLKLATLYVVKSDGREKARTVLSAGKAKLDKLDLAHLCANRTAIHLSHLVRTRGQARMDHPGR